MPPAVRPRPSRATDRISFSLRVPARIEQPSEQKLQTVGVCFRSQGRATYLYGTCSSVPVGQTSTQLPQSEHSTQPLKALISVADPRLTVVMANSSIHSSQTRVQRLHVTHRCGSLYINGEICRSR